MPMERKKVNWWLVLTALVLLIIFYGERAIEYICTHNVLRGQF